MNGNDQEDKITCCMLRVASSKRVTRILFWLTHDSSFNTQYGTRTPQQACGARRVSRPVQSHFPSLARSGHAATFRRVIRNIIFDWSGTLVDDLPAVWEASNHVFRRAGVPELPLDRFRAEFCLPYQKFYDRHIPHVPLDQLEKWFHGHFERIRVTPR